MADKTTKTGRNRAAAPTLGEIATIGGGRDITRGFVRENLKPQDTLLAAKGGNYTLYDYVHSDDQVKSTFQQRRLAVVSREWVVEPGAEDRQSKRAADFLIEQLEHIKFNRGTDKMMFGVFYGYAVAECLWARDGSQIVLDQMKVRKQRRFTFDVAGNLRLRVRDKAEGEIMPPRKFWTFNTGADNDDEPYGLGLAHWLYWPVFFKRNGVKFWLIFQEKFGSPTAVGKYPPKSNPDDQAKLLDAVLAFQSEAGIIIPDGMMIELVEATRGGRIDSALFNSAMNAAIAKVVLSQTMTTDDGSSLSQSETHMVVRDEVVKADSDLISESFADGPGTWLTEWNFPGATPPKIRRRIEDDPDLKDLAERDKFLSEIGYRPTPQYIEDTYGEGFEFVEPGQPVNVAVTANDGETGPEFAEDDLDPDAINRLVDELLDKEGWVPLMEALTEPIADKLREAESLEEFRDLLIEALDAMDTEDLVEIIAKAGFAGRVAGETGAETQD